MPANPSPAAFSADPHWAAVDESSRLSALMSALTTEHFVLQTAASGTITESAARSSLYVLSLSSSLVAMGVTASSREVFVPFAATVFPVLFLLGVFTVVRLVDTGLESMQYFTGIARIRAFYRSLGPEGATHFAERFGRWPETSAPSLRLGALFAFLGTTASMIAFINNVVAGAGVTLLAYAKLDEAHRGLAIPFGIATAVLLSGVFLAYQRWRFETFEKAGPLDGSHTDD